MFPVASLIATACALIFLVVAPSLVLGMDQAICVVLIALLRQPFVETPSTRMGHVKEGLWQALCLATFLCLLHLSQITRLADLALPLGVAGGGLLGMLAYGLSRKQPLGDLAVLKGASFVIAASAGAALVWHVWGHAPLHLAAIWGMSQALFLTLPQAVFLHLPIAAPSRWGGAVKEISAGLLFGLSLCLMIFGTEPDFRMGLVTVLPLMLAISGWRIWRWQAATA